MIRRIRRRSQRGQGLVEFALVFPVFILLLFGILDLGRAVYAYNTIGDAAREGARVAIVNQIQTSPDRPTGHPPDLLADSFRRVHRVGQGRLHLAPDHPDHRRHCR